MLVKSETSVRIIILSFVTIASSVTPMSNSRPQSRRHFGNEPTIPTSMIGTNRRVKLVLRTIESSSPIDRSARRIFFWPWHSRWYRQRWWNRPFGFGAGIYGGLGIGPGAGLGFHRPVHHPGFGGSPGIGIGMGAGIGAGYYPGVAVGAGAGAAITGGVVPSTYNQYQQDASPPISESNEAHSDHDRQPINYPDLPPITNDFDGDPPIPSNGPDFNAPSAVGFDDGLEHSVGYDRTALGRYKNHLKSDRGKYNFNANNEIDRAGTQQNGSYVMIDDTNKNRFLQLFRDRHKKLPAGQTGHEGSRKYFKDRETNSYGRDYESEEQMRHYDGDRHRDFPTIKHQLFTDRDLPRVIDAV